MESALTDFTHSHDGDHNRQTNDPVLLPARQQIFLDSRAIFFLLTSHPTLPTIVALTQSRAATVIIAKLVNSTEIPIKVRPVFSEGFDINVVVEDILAFLATFGSAHAIIQGLPWGRTW